MGLLRIGATTPAGMAAVVVIFLLIFAISFAFGPVPHGERRFSSRWIAAWARASAPRIAIAGAFAGAVLAGALLWGNVGSGSDTASGCANSMPPLTGVAVTDARILTGISSFSEMAQAADDGDGDRVRTLFFTEDAHNLTHDIDRPLRQQSADLGKQLCQNVIALENQIAGQIDPGAVATQTRDIADDLQRARNVLKGVLTPTPAVVSGDPCSHPIGAVTADPLTAQRVQNAIDDMRKSAQLAAAGDQNGAQTAFSGDAHNITHDIDGPLRQTDEALAVKLCEAVLVIELHLGANYDFQVMQSEATKAANDLQLAGQELGILQ
jgi:hypothetical protein